MTDDTIRRSIERHVVAETALSPDQVDITVKDGIAMLSGSVNNLLQKSRIRQFAESIRGVRSVVDTVVVKSVIREKDAIARDVRDNLAQIPPDRGLDVSVSVDRGIVTLKGTADSWVLSRLAVYQAMSIKGVSEVVNQINVKTRLERDDPDIALDVKRRLAADLYVDDALIEVTVKDGRVTLEGIVGTAAEKRRAAENAWISGVVAVDDRHLLVDWQEKDRMRRTFALYPANGPGHFTGSQGCPADGSTRERIQPGCLCNKRPGHLVRSRGYAVCQTGGRRRRH